MRYFLLLLCIHLGPSTDILKTCTCEMLPMHLILEQYMVNYKIFFIKRGLRSDKVRITTLICPILFLPSN